MNDDFLTNFRKTPRREFAAALYERINIPMKEQRNFNWKRLTVAAALCLALAAALVFSPNAQAALTYIFLEIGGVTYIEEDPAAGPTATPLPESAITTVPSEMLPLAEARKKFTFEISLPAWVPDGYVMTPSVRLFYFPGDLTFVEISWWGPNFADGPIILSISRPVKWEVDLSHVQEVQINGQPAGLTGGGWDADTGQWDTVEHNLTLTWLRGDAMYQLHSPGITAEEIIQVAESIP